MVQYQHQPFFFEEGDDAVIVVKNRLKREDLSVYWHGYQSHTGAQEQRGVYGA